MLSFSRNYKTVSERGRIWHITRFVSCHLFPILIKTNLLPPGFSNAHYGHPNNVIKPRKGESMADGWETARQLDRPEILQYSDDGTLKTTGNFLSIPNHQILLWQALFFYLCLWKITSTITIYNYLFHLFIGEEWAVFKLGFKGRIQRICVDTNHFKGNYPDSIKVEGAKLADNEEWTPTKPVEWYNILKPSKVSNCLKPSLWSFTRQGSPPWMCRVCP